MVKYCENCGSEIKDNYSFCAKCGTPTNSNNPKSSIRDKLSKEEIVIGLIVVIVTIILLGSMSSYIIGFILTPTENTINATITSANSEIVDTNETMFYDYYIEGNLFSKKGGSLEDYKGKAYFYDENGDVVTTCGISVYHIELDDTNQFTAYAFPDTPYNVTKVKVEIMNPQGEIVATAESPFIMGI